MLGWLFAFFKAHTKRIMLVLLVLAFADALLFSEIIFNKDSGKSEYDFLNVGQGDAELIQIAIGNGRRVKLLIDGGPANGAALGALSKTLAAGDEVIDLIAMTHAQADHMGGLLDVVKKYRVGAFLWTGRENDIALFHELAALLDEKKIPMIVLGAGDVLSIGSSRIQVLSPTPTLQAGKDLNSSSLVLRAEIMRTSALFVGDVGRAAEQYLANVIREPVDILKVPHHGSKTSLLASFLNAVRPKIAVIEAGRNTYGHPTQEALDAFHTLRATLFRTDKNGTVRFVVGEGRTIEVREEVD